MEEPDFWDNPERSQEMMKELKSLKDDKEIYENLESQRDDMETLIEMGYEEDDASVIPEIQEILDQFEADFENIRMKTLLSGEYDKNRCHHQAECRSRRNRVLRLGRNALPYVHQMGGKERIYPGSSGLSGRR